MPLLFFLLLLGTGCAAPGRDQEWHRNVDAEVVTWLERNRNATAEQFMKELHEIYNRPDMLKRFPHGFGPAK
ncbi:hypothetical protein [Hyalangium minutum]|uniref:Uncharacterized protein n=1 Tax=Hyalangium minutum TaxID=394096 RepID=A0A085WIE5_9BACT|nr:hypothetical protein [Hyalangium minutum]KFE67458.1 hypothetical protein DB31_8811 [Hyalangium minutum]